MKNLFSVSAVFDAREYIGSSVDASFPHPYTFLLSQGEYICSPLGLPRSLVPRELFKHGVGFATREEAKFAREKIIKALSDADLVAIVHCIHGVPLGGGLAVCDSPNDAVAFIQKLEKDIPTPENFSPTAAFTTTNYGEENHCWVGHALHFEFRLSKYYRHDIQLVQHVPASSAVPPLLNLDAIGIK